MLTTESFIDNTTKQASSIKWFWYIKYMANGSLIYSWYNGSWYMYRIHGHGKKTIGFYILQFPRCDHVLSKSKLVGGNHIGFQIQRFMLHLQHREHYTGLKTCRWNQKRSFYLKRFPRYEIFSKHWITDGDRLLIRERQRVQMMGTWLKPGLCAIKLTEQQRN